MHLNSYFKSCHILNLCIDRNGPWSNNSPCSTLPVPLLSGMLLGVNSFVVQLPQSVFFFFWTTAQKWICPAQKISKRRKCRKVVLLNTHFSLTLVHVLPLILAHRVYFLQLTPSPISKITHVLGRQMYDWQYYAKGHAPANAMIKKNNNKKT